jgi:hypothetical protein
MKRILYNQFLSILFASETSSSLDKITDERQPGGAEENKHNMQKVEQRHVFLLWWGPGRRRVVEETFERGNN